MGSQQRVEIESEAWYRAIAEGRVLPSSDASGGLVRSGRGDNGVAVVSGRLAGDPAYGPAEPRDGWAAGACSF